jgi:hypothetical protein
MKNTRQFNNIRARTRAAPFAGFFNITLNKSPAAVKKGNKA